MQHTVQMQFAVDIREVPTVCQKVHIMYLLVWR